MHVEQGDVAPPSRDPTYDGSYEREASGESFILFFDNDSIT